jgi:hypothetical protein
MQPVFRVANIFNVSKLFRKKFGQKLNWFLKSFIVLKSKKLLVILVIIKFLMYLEMGF